MVNFITSCLLNSTWTRDDLLPRWGRVWIWLPQAIRFRFVRVGFRGRGAIGMASWTTLRLCVAAIQFNAVAIDSILLAVNSILLAVNSISSISSPIIAVRFLYFYFIWDFSDSLKSFWRVVFVDVYFRWQVDVFFIGIVWTLSYWEYFWHPWCVGGSLGNWNLFSVIFL